MDQTEVIKWNILFFMTLMILDINLLALYEILIGS